MAFSSVENNFSASLGLATISTANSNLDGSGALSSVISGSTNGTIVKSVIIKAQTDTNQGMVRFFIDDSGGTRLLCEIYIPPVVKSGRDMSYGIVVPINRCLSSGQTLKASTQEANTFNLIAEGFDITFGTTTNYIGSSVEFISNGGSGVVSVANGNLNGTGSIQQIFLAGASSSYKGCMINSIVVKAQQTTTPGMIRLFVSDNAGSTKYLFNEIIVPSVVQSGTTPAFTNQGIYRGSFCIPGDYKLWATTENAETFDLIVSGGDWKNV